jgi:hypothetical protein
MAGIRTWTLPSPYSITRLSPLPEMRGRASLPSMADTTASAR